MTDEFHERLNRILPRLTSDNLLASRGLGNEIGYWIFDYPPEHEMEVRSFLDSVVIPALRKRQPQLRFAVVNLFELATGVLQERNLLERVFKGQLRHGNGDALAKLRPVLHEDKLAQRIASQHDLSQLDLLLLTGVGAAYPMVRSHTLLTSLQAYMKETPLVLFYPGRYDGFSLRLFKILADDHYYRAFRLVE